MEKRKLKNDVKGICDLHDEHNQFTQEERDEIDSLVAQGLDQNSAERYIRKLRGANRPEMVIRAGEVVDVRARSNWKASPGDPYLIVVSESGVLGRVREGGTEKVT